MPDSLPLHLPPPAGAEVLDVFGAAFRVLSDGSAAAGVVGDHHVPPGYGVPPHVHDSDDEIFVMLEGELTLTGPHGETRIGAGDCAQLPRGVAHSFRNAGETPARALVIALPGHQALEMFRHFDRAFRDPARISPDAIAAIAGQYGVRFA